MVEPVGYRFMENGGLHMQTVHKYLKELLLLQQHIKLLIKVFTSVQQKMKNLSSSPGAHQTAEKEMKGMYK